MASFVDRAVIRLKAGDGGNGSVSFHREKFVPNGGPDGGDGGRGGDIVLVADHNLHTLMDFRYQTKYQAENGAAGSSAKRSGKAGEDRVIRVPVGTVVKEKESGRVAADMFKDGERRVLLHGGRGGHGNARFATATRQAPSFAKPGVKTQWHEFVLELRTIADVGLVGFPNAGKSSLLARITAARPKIADYPFTTLTPNLGVAWHKGKGFAVADIPGLIERASEGAGLGFSFLRHVERTRLLLHVVDASGQEGRDPAADFRTVNEELRRYGGLDGRPQLVVANKMDLPESRGHLDGLVRAAEGRPVFPVSAATGEGVPELLDAVVAALDTLPEIQPIQEELWAPQERLTGWEARKEKDGLYEVSGMSMDSLLDAVNFDDYESLNWFHRTLKASGVIDRLRELGAREGDTVRLGEMEFDFIE
ncbi:MAG: GTPase ObgE [Clostridiales bacterium]|nr:GTPase ObgE [Clostridiales bacterium]